MTTRIQQLTQLVTATWDGNLISKRDRDELVRHGLVQKTRYGYNIATIKGIDYLYELSIIRP